MQMNLNWPEYLAAIAPTQAELASTVGVSQATVSRWMSGGVVPDAKQVVAVARAVKENPIVALVAAGYLRSDEINAGVQMPRRYWLKSFTEVELAEEMLRRVVNGQTDFQDVPMDVDHPAWAGGVGGTAEDGIESLPNAAKSNAQEVEEDDHTP